MEVKEKFLDGQGSVVENTFMKTILFVSVLVAFTSIAWPHQSLAQERQPSGAFPFAMPNEKPNRPLSKAVALSFEGF